MASSAMSSDTSFAPASIIITPERELATTRSRSLFSICSYEGLTMNSSFMYPMRVAEIGPSNGMSEMVSAVEAPMMVVTS